MTKRAESPQYTGMKTWILGVALISGCTDTQNVGDLFTFRAPRWGVSVGPDAGYAVPDAVAVDTAGDVIATGGFVHSVDFGGTVLDAGDTGAYFVTKRSGIDGSERWSVARSGANFSIAGVATDAQRSVIVGTTYGVTKYDPDGALVWDTDLHAAGDALPGNIAVSPSGRIFMSLELVNGTFRTPRGETLVGRYALVAISPDAAWLWGRALPIGGRVAATSDGGIVIAGAVDHSTTVAGTDIDLTRDGEGVAAKLDADGNFEWIHTFGEPGIQYGNVELAVNANGRVAVVLNTPTWGPPSEFSIDATGVEWAAQAQGGKGLELAVASTSDVVLTAGSVHDRMIDFGNGPMIGSMYLAARNETGALVDARVFGDPTLGSGGNAFTALATGPSGEIAFVGYVDQAIDIGGTQLAAPAAPAQANVVIGLLDPP